jgi:CLIP-associating protein 1/2
MIRDSAMKGTNSRAKVMSMQLVVKMNKTKSLPFRGFVPQLVSILGDANAGVRETAKASVVELFKCAPAQVSPRH